MIVNLVFVWERYIGYTKNFLHKFIVLITIRNPLGMRYSYYVRLLHGRDTNNRGLFTILIVTSRNGANFCGPDSTPP